MNPRRQHQGDEGLRPSTRRHIRRQIYLPLMIGIIAIVALLVLIWPEDRNPGNLADVSVICLGLPLLLLGVLTVALLGIAVFATEQVIRKLPAPFRKADRAVGRIEGTAKRVGDLAAKPLISTLSAWAGIRAFFHGLASIFRSDEGNRYE